MYIVALFHNKRRKLTFFFCIVGRRQNLKRLSDREEAQLSSTFSPGQTHFQVGPKHLPTLSLEEIRMYTFSPKSTNSD